MHPLPILLILVLFCSGTAWPSEYRIAPELMVEFTLPSTRWEISTTPPEQIVRQVAGGEGPALLEKNRRKLAANELFVWNPDSSAYLMLDVSALKEGESAPTDRQVLLSTRFAASALEAEEGLSDVRHAYEETRVRGVRIAYRMDAEYQRQGQPHRFIGLIGFSEPYWVYAYYNDPLANKKDLEEMESLLGSLRLHRNVTN